MALGGSVKKELEILAAQPLSVAVYGFIFLLTLVFLITATLWASDILCGVLAG